MNFVPFIGVTRVMFLYHYFFALIFSLAFVILLWDDLVTDRKTGHRLTNHTDQAIYHAVLAAIILGFLFFAPLTYGTPLTPAELQAHMWLPSWR